MNIKIMRNKNAKVINSSVVYVELKHRVTGSYVGWVLVRPSFQIVRFRSGLYTCATAVPST